MVTYSKSTLQRDQPSWKTKSICRHLLYETCDLRGTLPQNGETYRQHFYSRRNKYFKDPAFREHAINVMFEFYDYMSQDLQIWPMFGTLLGIIRDNDLILHDDDVDFGFFKKDDHTMVQKIDNLHGKNGFLLIRNEFTNLYSLVKEEVLIDLYEYECFEDDKMVKQGHRPFYDLTKEELFPLKTVEFRGRELVSINDPVKFFERYYGSNWRTPI